MNAHSLFSRPGHSPISRLAAVLLVALALSCLASCGRKPDTTGGDSINKASTGSDQSDLMFAGLGGFLFNLKKVLHE
jgi:hypothetical protein